MDWSEDAFFETPQRDSLDGGTTSAGALWHGVNPRWGHSMHTMCSYHGMFPAKVAHYFIQRYSRPGDVVLDPFSGRGTVPLQARVEGRRAICNDLNPLAYVLSRAKAHPPTWEAVTTFLDGLEATYRRTQAADPDAPDDIRMLYHPNTLRQICYLRNHLLGRPLTKWSQEELMIGGALAGIMHGSHRRDGTSQYLSISMPNTFSMSPAYVENYIRKKGLLTLDQDVFECLRDKLARLYLDDIAGIDGRSYCEDASSLLRGRSVKAGSVDLIVTSPPYLQVVNYGTANWIRLWLLGLDEVGRERGAGRRSLNAALDHRHTYSSYRDFLLRTLRGVRRVLKQDGVAVLVIGDVADPGKEPLPLAAKIWQDVGSETTLRLLELIEDHLAVQNKVSWIWGETKGQATDRDCALVLARDDGQPEVGPDVIDWDEPYEDGGPDAAHARVKEIRFAS
jgi:site-specific DNA-methyltransferase (adenine-specific)